MFYIFLSESNCYWKHFWTFVKNTETSSNGHNYVYSYRPGESRSLWSNSSLFIVRIFIFCTYDSYSEEEARKKIYSVSTRCYFAFGALVSEEVSLKIKGGFLFFFFLLQAVDLFVFCFLFLLMMGILISWIFVISELPRVRWVLPDSYLDVKNKDYGGMVVGFWMKFSVFMLYDKHLNLFCSCTSVFRTCFKCNFHILRFNEIV